MKTRFLWRALKARFRDQSIELSTIKNHVLPGDTVCDVGANKGSYTYWLSRWVSHGLVVAFEPQQRLADYLVNACSKLSLDNVTIEVKAVHSNSGTMKFYIPTGGGDRLVRRLAREYPNEILVIR